MKITFLWLLLFSKQLLMRVVILFAEQFTFKFLLNTNYSLNSSFRDCYLAFGFFSSWIAVILDWILSALCKTVLRTLWY